MGLVVDLSGKVEGVSGCVDDQVGLLLLIEGIAEDLLGVLVAFEGQVVDVLSIEGSSECGLGILGSLAGLGLGVDEDVVELLELHGVVVELLLGILKAFLGLSNNLLMLLTLVVANLTTL